MTDELKATLRDIGQADLELRAARTAALAALDELRELRQPGDRRVVRAGIEVLGATALAAIESAHSFSAELGKRG